MTRDIVIGNGRLTLCLDNRMRVRDFYYPRAGLENHVPGHEFRVGAWTDNRFSWLGDGWDMSIQYLPETLVARCTARNNEFGLEIEFNDAVHNFSDVYLRKLTVHNLGRTQREVKLFFSHDFHIHGTDSGDTALYEPATGSVVHYKRRRYFLISGVTSQNNGIHQFSTGYKESPGKEGVWRDAEDGRLEGNPIAQGAVDSVVSFKLDLAPDASGTVYYWIACGRSLDQVKEMGSRVKQTGVEQLLLETENYWSAWTSRQAVDLSPLPRNLVRMFKTSLLVMRAHLDDGGATVASCDSDILQFNRDTYSYVWPRDGALVALAFDRAGFQEASRLFFQFCDGVISPEGFFYHKYSADGSPGSSWHAWIDPKGQPQLPIQEDETALVLCALWEHFQSHRDVEFIGKVYANLVLKATAFLLNHRDPATGLPKPSFDVWEEKIGVFTATAATVCAALVAASKFARVFYDSKRQELLDEAAMSMKKAIMDHLYDKKLKRFVKAIYPDGSRDLALDSSLAFLFLYGPFDAGEEAVMNTMEALRDTLWTKTNVGGLARYENDGYLRVSPEVQGNPWFICTMWLARWHIARAASADELKKGMDLLLWAAKHASRSGVLSEQLHPFTGAPVSASPLVWSHSEFILTVCEYLEKQRRLTSGVV